MPKKSKQLVMVNQAFGGKFLAKIKEHLGVSDKKSSVYVLARKIADQHGWTMVSTKMDHWRTVIRYAIEILRIGTPAQIGIWNKLKANRERDLLIVKLNRIPKRLPSPPARRWRSKADFEAFYASREWQEARYRVLKRDGRLCACCKSEKGPFHVDHIKPRFRHPELELDQNNLQVLCADCNMGKGGWDETDWREDDAPKSLEEIDPLLAAFKATMN